MRRGIVALENGHSKLRLECENGVLNFSPVLKINLQRDEYDHYESKAQQAAPYFRVGPSICTTSPLQS